MLKRDLFKFLDIISWLVLLFIIIYAILKLTGIIHSFDWAVVIGASIVVGRYMQKIDIMFKDVDGIKKHCPTCNPPKP